MQISSALDTLIPEIIGQILTNSTQFDIVALSRTCKKLNRMATCSLYRSVTIDAEFTQFEQEYLYRNTTFIKTKASFTAFTKSLNNNYNCLKLCNLVKEFKVVNLPLDFYDFESFMLGSNDNFNSFFLHARLTVVSLNSSVSFNVLKQLVLDKFSRENLIVLNFNVNVHAPTKPLDDLLDDNSLRFQSLQTLSVGPFKQNFNLENILNIFAKESNNKLENLKLELQHRSFRLLDLLSTSDSKLKTSNYIIQHLTNYQNLKSLCLSSVNFNQTDLFYNLNNAEDFKVFENLLYLELNDIGVLSSNVDESLLHTFYRFSETYSLKYIKLDLRSIHDDLVPNFINERIKENQIIELDIIIRYNNMHITSLDELIDKYIKLVVLKHRKSLKKLSIEIKSERNLINLEEQLRREHLLELVSYKFQNLESLRLQAHFDCVLQFKNMLFNNMPNLENFWIVESNAIPVHFGIGNMYPGIYDKWWRIISLPKTLLNNVENHPLRYIKIDECLFVIKPNEIEKIQPKDSIDKLFDNKTRVSFDNLIN